MRCPACRNPCLDTDVRCPHCQYNMLTLQPDEVQLSTASVCGLIFAALGAGIVALWPMPEGLEVNQFALAGVGAVAGGVVGAIVGVIIDRRKKKHADAESARNPSGPTNRSAVG
jgi:hypothetical protein